MSLDFETAIHLTHGDEAAGLLRQAGATRIVVRRDLLTVGPCDRDPATHRKKRHEFWGGVQPTNQIEFPGVDADDDLKRELDGSDRTVIWATKAWSDLTFLWALVDAMARVGSKRPFIVRPESSHPHASVGAIAAEELRAAFSTVAPLDEATGKSCVAFWHAYTDSTPLAFDELRRRGAQVLPEFDRMLAGHAAWFPWFDGSRVRLSDADAAIFRWAHSQRMQEVEALMFWIGDSSLFDRVREWQQRGALAGTEKQPTLTEQGRELSLNGAATVAELPPLWVGGCRVNDPKMPWVRVGSPETGSWQLELQTSRS